ncbi:efflux RND transporter periplasmic adaptor subunit [Oceanihabitans sediminis]|uniref:efflux RND transporter periplasmic adaptor subunit n=1 Tax=Oceanihabitans sediminis TaxID=1812012 RepID=UPI000931BE79|nr:efflux RND transporter periplasmic adaptor subunit [Oceanihabitans sediminis]MDX1277813.1 efflux RND transporter periplasmic adaptor subunit [Oceanihabitans sediminis]MDX1772765.1 efflux RND transporter periplasmic adaptor subunit [Oceanihabitans sediminis]
MKNIFSILLLTLLIASCSGEKKNNSVEKVIESNDLSTIRTKRAELVNNLKELQDEIKLLDEKISLLDTAKHIPLITTFTAKQEVFKHVLEIQGNVTTKNLLTLTPEFNGILTNVYVKEGQKVKKGQTLAKIDDGGLSQQLAQLQIQADLAKTTFERQKRLWDQKIGSEIQFLQAKSNFEAQTEAVNQLQKQIAKTTVRAPFSGTIDDVISEQGSVVAAGQTPLMQIVNLDEMYIETDIPERYISDVVKGKDVSVEFPILGKTIATKIKQAGDVIHPANRTFKVEVDIPNEDKSIKPNLVAKLKINDYTNKNALLIPQSIISENANGEQYIYVIKNKNDKQEGVVERIIIKTGKTQGDVIEVLSGIEDGTEIVQEGARSIKDGQTVQVINQ